MEPAKLQFSSYTSSSNSSKADESRDARVARILERRAAKASPNSAEAKGFQTDKSRLM